MPSVRRSRSWRRGRVRPAAAPISVQKATKLPLNSVGMVAHGRGVDRFGGSCAEIIVDRGGDSPCGVNRLCVAASRTLGSDDANSISRFDIARVGDGVRGRDARGRSWRLRLRPWNPLIATEPLPPHRLCRRLADQGGDEQGAARNFLESPATNNRDSIRFPCVPTGAGCRSPSRRRRARYGWWRRGI